MTGVPAGQRAPAIRRSEAIRGATPRRAVHALVVMASLALGACAGTSNRAQSSGTPPLGRADYDWSLRTLAGEPVDLGTYRGRVLFINMWATWCPPCVAELASIGRLRDSLRTTDTAFLLVSPEQPEPVAAFMKRYRYDLPVFLEASPMPDAFGLRALPTTYVVDRAGNIVVRHRGAADWDRDAVRDLLRSL